VDLNNDGFTDVVVSIDLGRQNFFQNRPTAESRNNWFISFKFKGGGNMYGIGATAILHSKNMPKRNTQLREVSSYQVVDKLGYKDDRIIFGLGTQGVPIKLDIRWPNGGISTHDLSQWSFSSENVPIEITPQSGLAQTGLTEKLPQELPTTKGNASTDLTEITQHGLPTTKENATTDLTEIIQQGLPTSTAWVWSVGPSYYFSLIASLALVSY
jgi:hypothetical protein